MGQMILITGASSGIGYELAKVCARNGHDLLLVARREERLKELKEELEAAHGMQVWTYRADLTDAVARQQLYDFTCEQGFDIYALVNNAGFGDLKLFTAADWAKLNDMLQLNVVALTHLSHLFLPGMVQRGSGRLLNVASTAAFLAGPYMAVYYATKAYVLSLTGAIASELEATGVTATTLCPGPTQSEFQITSEMSEAKFIQGNMAKLPTSAEVAEYGYRMMEQGQRVAVHGLINKVLVLSTRFFPRKALANTVKGMQAPA